jgi:hypothetical protein
MTRWFLVAAVAVVLAGGCNKPEEADCRKAIRNMQRLLGTDKLDPQTQNIEGAVRKCRGASKKDSVECAIQAQTLDQLLACPFAKEMKIEPIEGVTPGSGSAPAGPGSGSAPAPGSGSGSAPAPAPGSGSAPAPAPGSGSAPAPGSGTAPGSGAGSGS